MHHQVDRRARDQLEGAEPLAAAGLGLPKEGQRCRGVPDRHQRDGTGARQRVQLQHRRGDDAQRPLGAHEQLLDDVARVVLAQAAQPAVDAAIGGDRPHPENEVAHAAVA